MVTSNNKTPKRTILSTLGIPFVRKKGMDSPRFLKESPLIDSWVLLFGMLIISMLGAIRQRFMFVSSRSGGNRRGKPKSIYIRKDNLPQISYPAGGSGG
jgi:hypothetical protein